ncbi:Concanavalin A-like lectin/glucanases superfamily [Pseudocohnilembus persalinus]|uniref:Concanavalin A-like lectin/glucanases superfamily n=1 Tax=Pseudocohnilembus persalinus TaxID=266149 RepID=A0A0V0Q877_PSEPJ|nr:Concanavalin A-like lectin/glucanases superfamily [Pseudocohnilembus persalinus]|eukprot:KRW98450.1 Concanavalin A-like lectin/glucanases superfamily [Pseudocohnilembus persalinus]
MKKTQTSSSADPSFPVENLYDDNIFTEYLSQNLFQAVTLQINYDVPFLPLGLRFVLGADVLQAPFMYALKGYDTDLNQWNYLINPQSSDFLIDYFQYLIEVDDLSKTKRYQLYEVDIPMSWGGELIGLSEISIIKQTSLSSQYYEQINKLQENQFLNFTFTKQTFSQLNQLDDFQFGIKTEIYNLNTLEQTIYNLPIGLDLDEQNLQISGILDPQYQQKLLKIYITAQDLSLKQQTEFFEINYASIIIGYYNFEKENIIQNIAPNSQQETGSFNSVNYDTNENSYEFTGISNQYIDTNFSDFPAKFSFFLKIKTTSTDFDNAILATNRKCGIQCTDEPGFTIYTVFGFWSIIIVDENGKNQKIEYIDTINDGNEHVIGFYTILTDELLLYQDGTLLQSSPECPSDTIRDCTGKCVSNFYFENEKCMTNLYDAVESLEISFLNCPELDCPDNCYECTPYNPENIIKSPFSLKIGDFYQSETTFFSGKILGIYIYNRKLTSQELIALKYKEYCLSWETPLQKLFDEQYNGVLRTETLISLDLSNIVDNCQQIFPEKFILDSSQLIFFAYSVVFDDTQIYFENNSIYLFVEQIYFSQVVQLYVEAMYNFELTNMFELITVNIKGKYDDYYDFVAVVNGEQITNYNVVTLYDIHVGEINGTSYIFSTKWWSQIQFEKIEYVFNDLTFDQVYFETLSNPQQLMFHSRLYQINEQSYLIVTISTTDHEGIKIYNVTDPSAPESVGQIKNGIESGYQAQIEVLLINDIWYAIFRSTSQIFLLNINDPNNPFSVNSSGFSVYSDKIFKYKIKNQNLVVLACGESGVKILKITDAQNGQFQSIFDQLIFNYDDFSLYEISQAKIFSIYDSSSYTVNYYLILALNTAGFQIYSLDVTDMSAFTANLIYEQLTFGVNDLQIFIVGNIWYIALMGDEYGLHIYDARNIESPIFIQSFDYKGVKSVQFYQNKYNKYLMVSQSSSEGVAAIKLDLIYNNTQTNPYQTLISQQNQENIETPINHSYYTQEVKYYNFNGKDYVASIVLELIGNQDVYTFYLEIFEIDSFHQIKNIYKQQFQQMQSRFVDSQSKEKLIQFERNGSNYLILYRYYGFERLNVYDITDISNIQLVTIVMGNQAISENQGTAEFLSINGQDFILCSDFQHLIMYDITDINDITIHQSFQLNTYFLYIESLDFYQDVVLYVFITSYYQSSLFNLKFSASEQKYVLHTAISIAWSEEVVQSQLFINQYEFFEVQSALSGTIQTSFDKKIYIVSGPSGIYIYDFTQWSEVTLIKYLNRDYAKLTQLKYMQLLYMNMKTYVQICAGESGIIIMDITKLDESQFIYALDTSYAMSFQTISKNDKNYNIIADQIGGIRISKIQEFGLYPIVSQEIEDGSKEFNIELKIYQPSYFQPYYTKDQIKLIDIQVLKQNTQLNTFSTTPSWMTVNLDQQIISLKPSTKSELEQVNKIYYVYSQKISESELQTYLEQAYPSSTLDYKQLKLELLSYGHINKDLYIQEFLHSNYNLQLSEQYDDYLEGILGYLKTKQFHGHMLANTDYITASNSPPVVTCSSDYLKYQHQSKQDTLCPENDVQYQFDKQLQISLGLNVAKVGKYISFRFSENTFYDFNEETLTYTISNIKRTFENKTVIDGLYYTDISWLAFSSEDRILQGTPTSEYYNNILEISLTASDGYDNATALLTIDHSTLPPKQNPNVDSLQTQFDKQNPNPQIGQPLTFTFQNQIPFIDEDNDDLKYLAFKFVKSESKFIPILDLPSYKISNHLSFNNYTLTFSGTVPKTYNKAPEIYCLQAFDGYSYSPCLPFQINYTDQPPQLKNKINNQKVTVNQNFEFSIQPDNFQDEDAQLSITATQTDGGPLPNWLQFDPNTNTFYGTPDKIETVSVRITATDIEGKSVQTEFEIQVQYSLYYLGEQLSKYGGIFLGFIGLFGVWNYRDEFFNLFCKKKYRAYRKDYLTIGETQYYKYIPIISQEYYTSCEKIWKVLIQKVEDNSLVASKSLNLNELITDNQCDLEPIFQSLKPILLDPKNKIKQKQIDTILNEAYLGKFSKEKLSTNFGIIIQHFINHYRLQQNPETNEIYNQIKQQAQKMQMSYAYSKITSPLDWYKEFVEILEKDINTIQQNKFPDLQIRQLELFDSVMNIIDPQNQISENSYKSEYLEIHDFSFMDEKNKKQKNKQKKNKSEQTNTNNNKINFLLLKNSIQSEAKMEETIKVIKSRYINVVKALRIRKPALMFANQIRFLKKEQYNIEGHMNAPLPSWLLFQFLQKTAILLEGIPQSTDDLELVLQVQDNKNFILREYLLEIKKPDNKKQLKLTKSYTLHPLLMSKNYQTKNLQCQSKKLTQTNIDKSKYPLMDTSLQSYSNLTLQQMDEDLPQTKTNLINKNSIYQTKLLKSKSGIEQTTEDFQNLSFIQNQNSKQSQLKTNKNIKNNIKKNTIKMTDPAQIALNIQSDHFSPQQNNQSQNQTLFESNSNMTSRKEQNDSFINFFANSNQNLDKKSNYPQIANQKFQSFNEKITDLQNENNDKSQDKYLNQQNVIFDSTFSLKKSNPIQNKLKNISLIEDDEQIFGEDNIDNE